VWVKYVREWIKLGTGFFFLLVFFFGFLFSLSYFHHPILCSFLFWQRLLLCVHFPFCSFCFPGVGVICEGMDKAWNGMIKLVKVERVPSGCGIVVQAR